MRDALSRLRDEGLVEMAPQRYTRVATLTVRDVHEVVPLLAAVHGLATELAVPRLGRTDDRELHAANEAFVGRAARARRRRRPTRPTSASTRSSSTRAATREIADVSSTG